MKMPKAKPPKPTPPATTATYHLDNQFTRLEMFAFAIAPALLANPSLNSGSGDAMGFARRVCELAQALDDTVDQYQ
jgi:hypothetical protein